ncbi:MAG: hypothetical protein R2867_39820 [Caldilineaceae bacterium]
MGLLWLVRQGLLLCLSGALWHGRGLPKEPTATWPWLLLYGRVIDLTIIQALTGHSGGSRQDWLLTLSNATCICWRQGMGRRAVDSGPHPLGALNQPIVATRVGSQSSGEHSAWLRRECWLALCNRLLQHGSTGCSVDVRLASPMGKCSLAKCYRSFG